MTHLQILNIIENGKVLAVTLKLEIRLNHPLDGTSKKKSGTKGHKQHPFTGLKYHKKW